MPWKVRTFCERMSAPSELSLNCSSCEQAGNYTALLVGKLSNDIISIATKPDTHKSINKIQEIETLSLDAGWYCASNATWKRPWHICNLPTLDLKRYNSFWTPSISMLHLRKGFTNLLYRIARQSGYGTWSFHPSHSSIILRLAQHIPTVAEKLRCKMVLADDMPDTFAKAALPRNTEQAAAIATIIQNKYRLELASPARLAWPLLLQYIIDPHRINLINRNAMKVSTFCERLSAPSELSLNCSSCEQAGNYTALLVGKLFKLQHSK